MPDGFRTTTHVALGSLFCDAIWLTKRCRSLSLKVLLFSVTLKDRTSLVTVTLFGPNLAA